MRSGLSSSTSAYIFGVVLVECLSDTDNEGHNPLRV